MSADDEARNADAHREGEWHDAPIKVMTPVPEAWIKIVQDNFADHEERLIALKRAVVALTVAVVVLALVALTGCSSGESVDSDALRSFSVGLERAGTVADAEEWTATVTAWCDDDPDVLALTRDMADYDDWTVMDRSLEIACPDTAAEVRDR
jgi:hypothetical protein